MSATAPAPRRFGCCSSCLIIVVLAVVGIGAGGYYAFQNADALFSTMRDQMREGTRKQLEKIEQAGNVPPEHQALYEELKERVLSEETGVLALHAVQESFHDALSDGNLDATEIAMLQAALDFLRRYPRPTLQEWWAYGEVHDALRRNVPPPANGLHIQTEAEAPEAAELEAVAPADESE